jgi:outer membrane lipoprotein SlyB
MKSIWTIAAVVVIAAVGLTGCATPDRQMGQSEANNTMAGATLGGVLGGVLGNNVGDGRNQVLGAALGALLGGLAGNQYGRGQDTLNNRLTAMEQAQSTVTVMVHNSNGSYTPVVLRRYGNEFIGPRGEYYTALPGDAQLKPIYGF